MPLPLAFGTPEQFALVRATLQRVGYTEEEVVRRCEVPNIYRFNTLRDGRTAARELHEAFDVVLRLFLDEEPLPWATVRAHLGDEPTAALRALGLLVDGDGEQAYPTVLLYPTQGLHLASDPTQARAGTELEGDVVFPAISSNTGHFLAMLPPTPVERLLELCAGTGVAALAAAAHCGHVWATDITERSVHFATFNARLNGLSNVTVAQGDLYEAVGDETFDRIVAHPPYVPEPETRLIFRDGGEDGEQVTRGIVAGLPRHLRPGGTLHCTCAVTDRVGRPFEQRVREWLGAAQAEFDVFFLPQAVHEPNHYFLDRAMKGHEPWAGLEQRHRTFERLEVERILYGSFVVRRRAADAGSIPPLSVRRRALPAARAADVLRLMARETEAAAPGFAARLLDVPLTANPAMEFALTHGLVDGDWQATACLVRLADEFFVDAKVSPWIAALLVRCDGAQSPRAILEELRQEGMAPAELPAEELAELLRDFVRSGILHPPGWAPGASAVVAGGALAAAPGAPALA